MKIIFLGRIPSKKNSRTIVCRGKYPISLPSQKYKDWHEEQSWALKSQMKGFGVNFPIKKCSVSITIYAPDKRRADLSNKCESLMDLLVDNEILEDDNWFVCNRLTLIFGGVDKENPRAEVLIK